MINTTLKVEENRLRRKASRQGLILQKSRRRDPDASGFGLYALLDASDGNPVTRVEEDGRTLTIHTATLDGIREWLNG